MAESAAFGNVPGYASGTSGAGGGFGAPRWGNGLGGKQAKAGLGLGRMAPSIGTGGVDGKGVAASRRAVLLGPGRDSTPGPARK